jgi:predicted nucleotidyltransferase
MAVMVSGRDWISGLPSHLDRHQRALTTLLDFCEDTAAVTSLSVGCSLGRGAADELSDVDAAVGVGAPRGAAGADRVRDVEQALVDRLSDDHLVDALRDESLTGDFLIRRLFVQLADGVQLDLAVVAEAEVRRGDAAPDFVPLYREQDADDPGDAVPMPSAYDVSADQVRAWAFQGWRALLDADKHLRRGSCWEAHQRLEEARGQIWRLWATAQGTSYPWHGLSQALDHDPTSVPAGIEATVAGLAADDLRSAVLAGAAVLEEVSAAAARRFPTVLPTGLATYSRGVLADSLGDRRCR